MRFAINSFLVFLLVSCSPDAEMLPEEIKFDSEKWQLKDGLNYPYRESLIDSVVYGESIRAMDLSQLLKTLGPPDRENENHLYYTISANRLGLWKLNEKSLVIKINKKDSIEWIKIHE